MKDKEFKKLFTINKNIYDKKEKKEKSNEQKRSKENIRRETKRRYRNYTLKNINNNSPYHTYFTKLKIAS